MLASGAALTDKNSLLKLIECCIICPTKGHIHAADKVFDDFI